MLDAPQAPDALARPLPPTVPIDPPASPTRPMAGDALFAAARTRRVSSLTCRSV